MRLARSFGAAAALLVAAFLFGGRLAPPEQVTQPVTPLATILLVADPAPTESADIAPARSAPAVNPASPAVVPPAAVGADPTGGKSVPGAARDQRPDAAASTLSSGDAGRVRPNVALPTPLNVDKTWRHRMAPTPTPPPVKRATALAPISPPRADVRPTPAPPGAGTPTLRAQGPTPTPCCGWDPPPLDRTAPGPGQ